MPRRLRSRRERVTLSAGEGGSGKGLTVQLNAVSGASLAVASAAALTVAAGLLACGLFFPTVAGDVPGSGGDAAGDANGADAGGDRTSDGPVAAKDFAISVSPSYIAIAPGQSVSVTVTVQRFGVFDGEVDIDLNLPPYVTPSQVLTFITGATTTFSLTSMVAAPPALAQKGALGDFPLTLQGKTSSGSETATAPITVHLSGELATFAAPGTTPFAVPANVSVLRIKAWGAGGGSGCSGGNGGGQGGPGGFVMADAVVVPGETIGVHVGGSVPGSCFQQQKVAGGEGSAVLRGSTILAIAGGGGGGGEGCAGIGGTGGAGGGTKGGSGSPGQCGGVGGGGATQTADGVSPSGDAGGGGGGLHSGGMGAGGNSFTCTTVCGEFGGNGGGSGGSEVMDAGVTVVDNVTGSQSLPPNTSDPDWAPDAGVPASSYTGSGASQPGSPGRIVLLVP